MPPKEGIRKGGCANLHRKVRTWLLSGWRYLGAMARLPLRNMNMLHMYSNVPGGLNGADGGSWQTSGPDCLVAHCMYKL
eukprot:357499-Chlamydomonas_euryale.AAC.5